MAQWGIKALMDKDDDTWFLLQDPHESKRKVGCRMLSSELQIHVPRYTHPPTHLSKYKKFNMVSKVKLKSENAFNRMSNF